MDDLQKLLAVEEIKQLKARYWRGVDSKDETLLRSVFADDAIIDFRSEFQDGDEGQLETPSPDAFARLVLEAFVGVITAHHGYTPEIDFISDIEAAGIWPMEDICPMAVR